jgi:hypothetical protein
MYGKNNTTSENIDVYLQNKHLMENNTPLNLSHYDSFYNPTYQGESQIHNNIVNQQNDTTNENNINNETNENNINENNDNDNDDGKKEEENNELEDPALKIFLLDNKNDKQKKENDDEEDNLSDLSGESNDEKDFTDNLLAQYDKVKRVRNRWKVSLKGCIVQKDKTEYICGKVHGELSREW